MLLLKCSCVTSIVCFGYRPRTDHLRISSSRATSPGCLYSRTRSPERRKPTSERLRRWAFQQKRSVRSAHHHVHSFTFSVGRIVQGIQVARYVDHRIVHQCITIEIMIKIMMNLRFQERRRQRNVSRESFRFYS